MSIDDTRQLSERARLKALAAHKAALERQLQRLHDENRGAEQRVAAERHELVQLQAECAQLRNDVRAIDEAIAANQDTE